MVEDDRQNLGGFGEGILLVAAAVDRVDPRPRRFVGELGQRRDEDRAVGIDLRASRDPCIGVVGVVAVGEADAIGDESIRGRHVWLDEHRRRALGVDVGTVECIGMDGDATSRRNDGGAAD